MQNLVSYSGGLLASLSKGASWVPALVATVATVAATYVTTYPNNEESFHFFFISLSFFLCTHQWCC
ncbi:hypothetical protein F4678DRAFT_436283 [Xylaria arbuscula]|nr:hypothetical protein F4678DRAFT_436283 [Xylaria arbuscula]